jgi:1-acyl-sn-glycerol-3-phosphate acyltransferase
VWLLYRVCRSSLVVFFRVLFGCRVYGAHYLPRTGGYIIASNHVSFLDPLAVGVGVSRPLRFLARHDLFRNPYFGWLIRNVGAIPIKKDRMDLAGLKNAIRIIREGQILVIFPEGRRMDVRDKLVEPSPGVGFLASLAGVPIIPARVVGTEKALPKNSFFIRLAKVSVYFGQQITIDKKMSYQEIASKVMQSIRSLAS